MLNIPDLFNGDYVFFKEVSIGTSIWIYFPSNIDNIVTLIKKEFLPFLYTDNFGYAFDRICLNIGDLYDIRRKNIDLRISKFQGYVQHDLDVRIKYNDLDGLSEVLKPLFKNLPKDIDIDVETD